MSTSPSQQPAIHTKPAPFTIEPVRDVAVLRQYIHENWRANHILSRDERMFNFQYRTPFVDSRIFPKGVSVLGAYEGTTLVGFLGAIIAPYPRPQSFWLALWHVLPTLKGGGHGGKLLAEMQKFAVGEDGRGNLKNNGWIGTFGAGPEALPVYLKRGYACRAVRRWTYTGPTMASTPAPFSLHAGEVRPSEEWLAYRYDSHPIFKYQRHRACITRTESNAWGRVTHVLRLDDQAPGGWRDEINGIYMKESAEALASGQPYLMDAWCIDTPGEGWKLAADDLPSVFHPPTPRGNLIYTVGRPFVCGDVQKGECDQDRPN